MNQRDKLWDADQTVKLIKTIEKHRLLWDTQNADFRDILKKRRTFTVIGAEFGCNGLQVERKWKDLLSQYRREKIQSNSTSAAVTSWFAFPHMSFVDAQESFNSLLVAPKASPSCANSAHSYLQAYKWYKRKYPSASGAIPAHDLWPASKMFTPPNVDSKNRDEFEIFGEGVAAKLRKIHDPRIQLCVQRDIDNALYDALISSGVAKLPLSDRASTNASRYKPLEYIVPGRSLSSTEQR